MSGSKQDSLVQLQGSKERLRAVAALALALEVLETTFNRRRSAAGSGTRPQQMLIPTKLFEGRRGLESALAPSWTHSPTGQGNDGFLYGRLTR